MQRYRGAFFYASNFSIGVNIFFNLNSYLAGLMERFNTYRPSMKEIHHIHKLDAPSGTAITLADQIISKIKGVDQWTLERDKPGTIYIDAIREGEVKGYHEISYTSEIDEIKITHNAKSRKGFAMGAILAAEFLQGKEGNYGMEDLLKL